VSISLLRRIVAFVCVLSVAGMIAFSVANNIGGAMTAGLIGGAAMLCLITGNAIHVGSNGGGAQEALGAELEARVRELIDGGVEEQLARSVVSKAIRFGVGET
jgi:hypothetical protein